MLWVDCIYPSALQKPPTTNPTAPTATLSEPTAIIITLLFPCTINTTSPCAHKYFNYRPYAILLMRYQYYII